MQVDFYFSVSSRYSYLALTQLDKISEQTGCTFNWIPLNNHSLLQRIKSDPFRSEVLVSGQYDGAYREYDAKCWADYYQVPFVEPVNFRKDPPYLTHGCYAAGQCGVLERYCRRLSQAIFVENQVIEESDLVEYAVQVGMGAEEFNHFRLSEETRYKENTALTKAIDKGVFGVPSFIFNDKLFWGNDRLLLLTHALQNS